MEITVKELDHCDVISVSGYIERFTGAQLTRAVETSNERGKYNLVIDLSRVEYIQRGVPGTAHCSTEQQAKRPRRTDSGTSARSRSASARTARLRRILQYLR
jgi:hypothetical protein